MLVSAKFGLVHFQYGIGLQNTVGSPLNLFFACANYLPDPFLQTISANMMDLDAVKRLKTENHLMETEMSMQHIWATEVEHINPLTRGRNVIQELIDG